MRTRTVQIRHLHAICPFYRLIYACISFSRIFPSCPIFQNLPNARRFLARHFIYPGSPFPPFSTLHIIPSLPLMCFPQPGIYIF